VCKEDDGTGCEDLLLAREDVEIWELNRGRLGRAIAWALECEPMELRLLVPKTVQVASFGDGAVSVLLTLPQDREEFQQVITALVAESRQPFVLVSATSRFVDRRCRELLEKRNAEFIDLASSFTIEADGSLKTRGPAKELLARFRPGGTDRHAAQNVFSRCGSTWKVILNSGAEFHIGDTLGAHYLNYLLHHPNVPISAFDLEVAVRPEKAGARSKDSIQEKLDPRATREYLRELEKLRAQQEEAREDGDQGEAERLEGEIDALESALEGKDQSRDAGERARGNVGKAIAKVVRKLKKGGGPEKAFAWHLEKFVSTGYECSYSQEGRPWA